MRPKCFAITSARCHLARAYSQFPHGVPLADHFRSHSCLQACGALFSIAPFVTFRSYPCAMSVISAGGQLGAVLMQGVFFTRVG